MLGGKENIQRRAVGNDIAEAILKTKATKDRPATYYGKEEQERRLVAAFEKWEKVDGTWSAASHDVRNQSSFSRSVTNLPTGS